MRRLWPWHEGVQPRDLVADDLGDMPQTATSDEPVIDLPASPEGAQAVRAQEIVIPSPVATPEERTKQERAFAWYRQRVQTWPPDLATPGRDEDRKAASKKLGPGFRHLVDEARKTLAPRSWLAGGPKGRKREGR